MVDTNRIKAEMTYKQMTQEDLAKLLGVTILTIHNRFKRGNWKLTEIPKLMKALDLPQETFLEEE